jgi:outer membrane protein assembly factor BamB
MITRKASLSFALLASLCLTGADWRQFRGNRIDGIADDPLPTAISGDSIKWSVELPGRGLSAPIVVGNRLYLSCSSGYDQNRLHLVCFDKQSGEQIWERKFWATGRTVSHPKMCNATPTPCSDGERIFASFSSNDVLCTDLDGNLQWFRGLTYDYPNATNSLGMSSSPIVVGGVLIVQTESDADSFAFGLDVETGESLWKRDRPRAANWTSPVALFEPEPVALLQSSKGIQAVEPRTGEVVWEYTSGASTIPSSVVAGGSVFIPSNGLTAITPQAGQGEPKQLWNSSRLGPSTPSPLVHENMVFSISNVKISAADRESGEVLWELRVKGPFSSSPIASGEHLYLFSEEGLAQVVQISRDKGTLVSDFDFGETLLGTPAASDGAIFIRSDGHLWKIAE